MKSNLLFSWPYHFYLHNSFDVWLVFWENADVTYGFKNNFEIKIVKKVKESYLKIVNGELKQYQTRRKQTTFPILVSKLYTDIWKDDRRWLSLAISTVNWGTGLL